MNRHNIKRLILANSRGSVLVLVGFLLFVFIGVAALAIDIGYLSTSRNELQNAADAAALGASRKLGNIYQIMAQNSQDYSTYNVDNADGDKAAIIATAKNIALQNEAANEYIIIDETRVPSDIQIGVWDPNINPPFTETDNKPNAVRVTAHRDALNPSKQISLFFAGIFGIDSAPVSAVATAALTGQSTTEPGELEIPIGLSKKWFYDDTGNQKSFCGDIIKFHPTSDPEACAGWTSFNQYKNDKLESATKNTVNNVLDGTFQAPSSVGDEFAFTNGTAVSDLFKNLLMKYGNEGYDVDGIYDPVNYPQPREVINDASRVPLCDYGGVITECDPSDVIPPDTLYDKDDARLHERYPKPNHPGNSGPFTGELRYAHEWETTVPVYDASNLTDKSSCTPGTETIIGYVKVVVYDVGGPGNQYIKARVSCDIASPNATRGGGTFFGLIGTISGLVE